VAFIEMLRVVWLLCISSTRSVAARALRCTKGASESFTNSPATFARRNKRNPSIRSNWAATDVPRRTTASAASASVDHLPPIRSDALPNYHRDFLPRPWRENPEKQLRS
jgi:hypothetical protein